MDSSEPAAPLDLYCDGDIITADEHMPEAEAFVVAAGTIVAVGGTSDLRRRFPAARETDLRGRSVLPGLTDEGATKYVFQQLQRLYEFDALVDGLETALHDCAATGVTTIHDMIKTRAELRAFQRLYREGRLPIRVCPLIWLLNDQTEFDLATLRGTALETGFGDDRLWFGGVKLAIDGADENSAYRSTIDGRPITTDPVFFFDEQTLTETVAGCEQANIRTQVHALGDLAVDQALAAFAAAGASPTGLRHRIEHFGNWLCTDERLNECGRLGGTPVPNPPFPYYFGKSTFDMLGGDDHYGKSAFPFATLAKRGLRFSGGSDGPGYYPVNGLRDLGTMMQRRSADGLQFDPAENLSFDDALRAQTINGAWLGYREGRLGSLSVGKSADFLVLDTADIRSLNGAEISDLPVISTYVGGTAIYERPAC